MPEEFIPKAGGSVVSRSILAGETPLKWAVREASVNPVDNGWRFFGLSYDDDYLADPAHLVVADFNTVAAIEPAIIPIWNFPVGSDLQVVREGRGVRIVDTPTGAVVVGPGAEEGSGGEA
ncbi:MAG: DUF2185 domain-containing protein [Naasia sp.]